MAYSSINGRIILLLLLFTSGATGLSIIFIDIDNRESTVALGFDGSTFRKESVLLSEDPLLFYPEIKDMVTIVFSQAI